ncbi:MULTISPECIES: hypothetical protein [unclassified Streptosporangium]|uniref:hypothetical protein n=1 Tax=unclassified Streptosporangium TaxID=2632669 RepID=UPI002E295E33|nr:MULTISPECIES: hypothetical protein [unclassified Streptosporangium]
MCDWLLKPPTHIKITGDLETVLGWLDQQWRQLEPSFAYPGQEKHLGSGPERLQVAGDALRHCGSMAWGHWLKGERFGHTAAVGCPDVHAPHYRCPTGP